MKTINKALQNLTEEQIYQISEEYLLGWQDLEKKYHFRVKGLNHRREDLGLPVLTKDWSLTYRIDYVRAHFSYDEIHRQIFEYSAEHRVGDTRWTGIELFGCRFGREYAKAFKELLGNKEYRKLSEMCRVSKVTETQELSGGYGLANPITRTKALKTCLQRYGVSNPMQQKDNSVVSPFVQESVRMKAADTKAERISQLMEEYKRTGKLDEKSLRMSVAEVIVFDLLIQRFGADDVFYSYGLHPYDVRYPFNCDFYIKSLDLFIELNIHYSHGKHWFDETNHDDQLRVKHLLQSSSKKSHDAVHVWTETDVRKRECARKACLNYLVFWDSAYGQINHVRYPKLRDFYEWFNDFVCDTDSFLKCHPENTY